MGSIGEDGAQGPRGCTMQEVAIARAAHEANRAYCASIGDDSQLSWEDAPSWQKASAINGVIAILDGAVTSPSECHESWLRQKVSEGWVYGAVKDAEKKTHPCMVPYEDLPASQRMKDKIFRDVVLSMALPQTATEPAEMLGIYAAGGREFRQIENAFTYHAPRPDQPARYTALRDAAKRMALRATQMCPPSRELSLALTNLEQFVFWANAAIARNETAEIAQPSE